MDKKELAESIVYLYYEFMRHQKDDTATFRDFIEWLEIYGPVL